MTVERYPYIPRTGDAQSRSHRRSGPHHRNLTINGIKLRLASLAAIGCAGAAAFGVQFVIDIVIGLGAADHAAMSASFERVQAIPGVMPVVYTAGPCLFYIGLSMLVIQLAFARRTRAWVPLLVLTGSILPLMDKDLLPLAALCLLAANIPLAAAQLSPAPTRTRQESTR